MSKPTYDQLRAALGQLLCEYSDIDEMLDQFAGCSPDGMTPDESKKQYRSNRTRDRIAKIYKRAS